MNDNLAYQDPLREELIDGKIVMMSPRPAWNHNRVAFNIAHIFENYLYGKKCTSISDGTDLFLTENDRFVPDFMVVCDPNKIKQTGVHGAPDLVVEVLSPSTSRNDKTKKKDVYARCGVREYWLVSPADKTIEAYRNNGTELVLHEVYAVYPDWMLPRLTESERAAVVTQFKCSLFDDFDIPLDDIFSGLLPSE